jgi:AcrR family transcriptional regulator
VSPRPRKVSDEEVFAAAQRAMSRLGPADLTLAAIAAEAGVTAGALVQRFGSKRALQLALSARAAAETTGFIDALREKHRSPLAALHAYADCLAGLASSPAALSRNLAYLQIDLTDPDLRRHLLTQAGRRRGSAGDCRGDQGRGARARWTLPVLRGSSRRRSAAR